MTPTETRTGHEAAAPVPSRSKARPRTPTRVSGVWIATVGFAVLLLLLAIFLLQNGQRVQVSYLGIHARLPLAVAMLLSAVGCALLVATAGVARVLQLRHATRANGAHRA
ncbi:MAG: DUF1049 domain-containing protein [Frankiaceae bacterium]|nr:DUF1049 domain-containing protein [Frankiaceae bacterium]